uniref:hypothetical protein n=1 Tax=Algoriphagus sp. TaxID=1872435 RepID=UPI0040478C12
MKSSNFSNIYILDSYKWWDGIDFNLSNDLCLTFDFSLHEHIKQKGGNVFYIDHLIDKQIMHQHNFNFYDFFKRWHYDLNGNDIFTYRNIEFGFSLRLEIWNDLSYYLRLRYCLNELLNLNYNQLFVGTEVNQIVKILDKIGLNYSELNSQFFNSSSFDTYYFPIHQWLDEKVRYKGIRGFKYIVRDYLGFVQASFVSLFDKIFVNKVKRPLIFVQEYHPTKKIVIALSKNSLIRVLLATFSKNFGFFRYIPVFKKDSHFLQISKDLLTKFQKSKTEKYFINNDDISNELYEIIENRVSSRLPNYLNSLDSIISYLQDENLKLIILVTNIGKTSTLIHCVGKNLGVPTYLIINGFMSGDFLDESKYANYVNSYSISIKNNFYKNMNNIFALGDPRMDTYFNVKTRLINRINPTITIGTSAHSIIDLNSFVAVEFEFLHQVLTAIHTVNNSGTDFNILIKVRANGYIEQYRSFVGKYFPGLKIVILDNGTMLDVFSKTDLYISLYSQTLIEASCVGIPVIYHKNDVEKIDPPFDNKSELVTTTTTSELIYAIKDFINNSDRFDNFLEKKILEKYIGPLDGNNLQRNLDFIYSLIYNNEIV